MLDIPLRAATPVASQDVLAAMLAPMVSITFINICKNKPARSLCDLFLLFLNILPTQPGETIIREPNKTLKEAVIFPSHMVISGGTKNASEIRFHSCTIHQTMPCQYFK